MSMSRFKMLLLAGLLVVTSFLAACGIGVSNEEVDPKKLLTDAFNKSLEINSYAFDGDFTVSLEFDESTLSAEEKMAADIFKNLTIQYKGAYQEDIEKMELILETKLNLGDLQTSLQIPLLIEGEKIWVKVPALPGIIPEEMSGQSIEIDLKQVAEMSGEEYIPLFTKNKEEDQAINALAQEIIKIFVNNLDDSYLTVTNETDTVVKVDISGDKFYAVIESILNNSMPQVIKLLEDPKNSKLLGLSPDAVKELKVLEKGLPEEAAGEFKKVKESMKVNKAEFTTDINKDGFISKQGVNFDATFTDQATGKNVRVVFTSKQNSSKINEKQEFTTKAPTENVINLMDLMGSFMMGNINGSESLPGDVNQELPKTELSKVDELLIQVTEQDWFTPEIEELLYTNQEFYNALYNEKVLEMLLNDEKARKEWFSQYNIKL